jgi:hypothetical protein
VTEHDSQVAVIQWAWIHQERYPALKLLFAVPNAGKRSIGAANYYLAEGLKSGIPDLILPIPHEPIPHQDVAWCGLAIEMKDGKNKPTENQLWWLNELKQWGWKTVVCYSADEAINEIKNYLGIVEVEE